MAKQGQSLGIEKIEIKDSNIFDPIKATNPKSFTSKIGLFKKSFFRFLFR